MRLMRLIRLIRLRHCAAIRLFAAVVAWLAAARAVPAQTQYYNLDSGRPGRIEDAEATARYSLGIDLAPLQFERLLGGTNRYRVEPKLSYGILPFTEIELRVPVVRVDPPGASGAHGTTGVASVAIGALHAFNLETAGLPAIAIGGEAALPVGGLAAPGTAYLVKMLLTKTTPLLRIHLNAGAGTYSVRASADSDSGCPAQSASASPGQTGCAGGPPVIVDGPCGISGPRPTATASGNMVRAATFFSPGQPLAPRTSGGRWMAGLGFDRALALQSLLLTGDVVGERFVGLYAPVDWTAEAGIRRQMTPTLVMQAGGGWHFAGVVRSTSAMFGLTYELATVPLTGSRGRDR